jgi:hypothetical protein
MHALLLAHIITPCYNNTKPFNKKKEKKNYHTLPLVLLVLLKQQEKHQNFFLKTLFSSVAMLLCTQPMHLLQYTHHPLLQQQHKTKQNKILKKTKTFPSLFLEGYIQISDV